jgi:hypothetical protein
MKKFIFLLLLFTQNGLYAQIKNVTKNSKGIYFLRKLTNEKTTYVTPTNTPLHIFLQSNFDSAIIMHEWSSWFPFPDFKIIAKSKGRFYAFTYRHPYGKFSGGYSFPGGLTVKFMNEVNKFKYTMPDTNQYFLPQNISNKQIMQSWTEFTNSGVIKLNSNYQETVVEEDDGGNTTFYTITKDIIKLATFYSLYRNVDANKSNKLVTNAFKLRKAILKSF